MTMNPVFELSKNFIVEGLTCKLAQNDKNALGKPLQINVNPRVYFEGGQPSGDGPAGEVLPTGLG